MGNPRNDSSRGLADLLSDENGDEPTTNTFLWIRRPPSSGAQHPCIPATALSNASNANSKDPTRVSLGSPEEFSKEYAFVPPQRKRPRTCSQASREVLSINPALVPTSNHGSYSEANLNPDSDQLLANQAKHSPPTVETELPKAAHDASPQTRHTRRSKRLERRSTESSQPGTSKRRVMLAQTLVVATRKSSLQENEAPTEGHS